MKLIDLMQKFLEGSTFYKNPEKNTVVLEIFKRDDDGCVLETKTVPVNWVKTANIVDQQFCICVEQKDLEDACWESI